MSGVVVVSPHLDDAVLSASSRLLAGVATVVSVCTGIPSAGTDRGWWDVVTGAHDPAERARRRLAEDDAALALAGSSTVRLGLPDAQHRAAGPARPGEELAAVLPALLEPLLAGADEVWLPAGIGCHADHLATRDAGRAVAPAGATVHLYADLPYCVQFGWPPSVTGVPAASPYLDVEAWLAAELAAAGHGPGDLPAPTVHRLDDDTRRRKVALMRCYTTQLPALDPTGALASGDPRVAGFELSWGPL